MQVDEAIEMLIKLTKDNINLAFQDEIEAVKTVLRYINTMQLELEKKDKVIDEMAAILTRYMSTIDNKPYDLSLGVSTRKMTLEEVKEYFYKKVSDNK